jgi:hypothetical protein
MPEPTWSTRMLLQELGRGGVRAGGFRAPAEVESMELAGLEPGTSGVRYRQNDVAPVRFGVARRRSLLPITRDSLSSVARTVERRHPHVEAGRRAQLLHGRALPRSASVSAEQAGGAGPR